MPKKAIETYWGPSQHQKVVSEGITFHSTAGHGGFHLSHERQRDLLRIIPNAKPFTGTVEWLEEDEDWQYALLAWPDLFSDYECWSVLRSYTNRPSGYVFASLPSGYWNGTMSQGVVIRQMSDRFVREHGDDWVMSGWGTMGKGRHILSVRRVRDNEIGVFHAQEIPYQHIYSDSLLSTFTRSNA